MINNDKPGQPVAVLKKRDASGTRTRVPISPSPPL